MVFGNAIIGVFEGLILAKLFKLRRALCILVMIPANYFSAWVGGLFLGYEITNALPFNLYNTWGWIWVMVFLTFLITLLLEWPFVFYCLRKESDRFKKSLQGNLLVNCLSYVLLFGWYWMASGTTLYTKMHVVQPSEISFPKQGLVYYISETNGVCRLDLNSHQTERVCTVNKPDNNDRLLVKPSVFDSNRWEIVDLSQKVAVASNLEVTAVQYWRDTNDPSRIEGISSNFGDVPKLGAAEQSDWNFRTGFWPIEGLQGGNQKTGAKIYFSLETPFVAWAVRNATLLPGDYVVFQLGDDQICLLEAATQKIALLARGQGPVVVIPK